MGTNTVTLSRDYLSLSLSAISCAAYITAFLTDRVDAEATVRVSPNYIAHSAISENVNMFWSSSFSIHGPVESSRSDLTSRCELLRGEFRTDFELWSVRGSRRGGIEFLQARGFAPNSIFQNVTEAMRTCGIYAAITWCVYQLIVDADCSRVFVYHMHMLK